MTAATITLTDFLLARIADDEADARAIENCDYYHGVASDAEEQVQRLSDPARVLAECASKRRIVEAHPIITGPRILPIDSTDTDFGCETCHCIDPIHHDGIVEAGGTATPSAPWLLCTATTNRSTRGGRCES